METRSAIVAILGRPNVGKSTLLNRIIGEHLSAISPKPQTTARAIRGIYSDDRGQLVFVDTPGIHDSNRLVNRAMVMASTLSARDADILLFLEDLTRFVFPSLQELLISFPPEDFVKEKKSPPGRLVALTKKDLVPQEVAEKAVHQIESAGFRALAVSGTTGEGVPQLLDLLFSMAPQGPHLYPDDIVSDLTLREIVVELIREAIFHHLHEELPYHTFVEIEEFAEDRDPVYIRAVIHVNKPSQKGMVIGAEGKMILQIGKLSRMLIEDFLKRKVYLDLWVKVTPKWVTKPSYVHRLTGIKPHLFSTEKEKKP